MPIGVDLPTLIVVRDDGELGSKLGWRAQALLWPALCSTCTLAGLALYAVLFRDGLRHSPGLVESVAWIVVFVPIIVVLCSLVFGGIAVAAGLLVRSVVRLVPTTSVSRTVLLAAVTGSCTAGVVIGFFALFRQSWAVAGAAYGYAAAIGVVAAFASAVYAPNLFDESASAIRNLTPFDLGDQL